MVKKKTIIDWSDPEQVKIYNKEYWKNNKEEIKERRKGNITKRKTLIDWSDPKQRKEYFDKMAKKNRSENREKVNAIQRASYYKNKTKIRERQSKYYQENKEHILKKAREKSLKLRLESITRLGGKCVKCGYDDIRALQIDHIHGDGAKERKGKFKGYYERYYKYLISVSGKELFDNYQLLCANCNWIKKHTNNEKPYYNKK